LNPREKKKAGRCLSSRLRCGVATVETAVALPLLVFLTLGSIEIANAIFVRQGVVLAAYEGARVCSQVASTEAAVNTRVAEVLSARGITSYNLNVTPALTTATPRGTVMTVRVRVTNAVLTYSPFQFFSGKNIEHSTTMVHQ
jgi:Flp pilus assembly protein TadG